MAEINTLDTTLTQSKSGLKHGTSKYLKYHIHDDSINYNYNILIHLHFRCTPECIHIGYTTNLNTGTRKT